MRGRPSEGGAARERKIGDLAPEEGRADRQKNESAHTTGDRYRQKALKELLALSGAAIRTGLNVVNRTPSTRIHFFPTDVHR